MDEPPAFEVKRPLSFVSTLRLYEEAEAANDDQRQVSDNASVSQEILITEEYTVEHNVDVGQSGPMPEASAASTKLEPEPLEFTEEA
jgi:hypothetical protein